ncbi:hypothetical protein [Deinococcus pimensis]|uniref:hypothetical protein n=1 Tax=Deinococcus pimensis TaxID=309888 RepID=UPI0004869312|nr:hypothetical protein [Deinococcus pimensis]
MRRILPLSFLLVAGAASAGNVGLSLGPSFGGGLGADIDVMFREVAATPFGGRFTLAANLADPYTATPESNERELGFNVRGALDVLYALDSGVPDVVLDVYAGPRVDFFLGMLGGRDGTVTTDVLAYGAGTGVTARYRLLSWLDLVGDVGIDAYLPPVFNVTDSNPNSGVQVYRFAPGDADYADVDAVVNQPKFVPRLKLGLQIVF